MRWTLKNPAAIEKDSDTKRWFFEKVDKIGVFTQTHPGKKRERTQINEIRNEREFTTDNVNTRDHKRIL